MLTFKRIKRLYERIVNKLYFHLYYKHTKKHKDEVRAVYETTKRHAREVLQYKNKNKNKTA